MKIEVLSTSEQGVTGGFTHRVTVTAADLTEAAADTAQTIALLPVNDGCLVTKAATRVVTPFADASDAAFDTNTITVGDGSDTDRYVTSQQTNANGSPVNVKAGTANQQAYVAADTIDLVVNAMAAKSLVNVDTGEVDIYLAVYDLNPA